MRLENAVMNERALRGLAQPEQLRYSPARSHAAISPSHILTPSMDVNSRHTVRHAGLDASVGREQQMQQAGNVDGDEHWDI